MKVYSNSQIAKIFIGAFLIIWLLILLIITTNHALSCVDNNGCLRSQCEYKELKPAYKAAILKNIANCPYTNLTG